MTILYEDDEIDNRWWQLSIYVQWLLLTNNLRWWPTAFS